MRSPLSFRKRRSRCPGSKNPVKMQERWIPGSRRSEEHTSELQSRSDLVCRLLLEKKKRNDHRLSLHCVLYPGVPDGVLGSIMFHPIPKSTHLHSSRYVICYAVFCVTQQDSVQPPR